MNDHHRYRSDIGPGQEHDIVPYPFASPGLPSHWTSESCAESLKEQSYLLGDKHLRLMRVKPTGGP
jgi:hypothetical protein